MYLPKLDNIQSSRESATEFRGYNHTHRVSGKEFYDMKNMSGRNYPALSPRVQRGKNGPDNVLGLHAADKLYWVSEVYKSDMSGTYGALFCNVRIHPATSPETYAWKELTNEQVFTLSTEP